MCRSEPPPDITQTHSNPNHIPTPTPLFPPPPPPKTLEDLSREKSKIDHHELSLPARRALQGLAKQYTVSSDICATLGLQ